MSQLLQRLVRAAMILVLTAGAAYAQTASITGVVTDSETGEPLPGANVAILELETGTITTPDGTYSIDGIPTRSAPYEIRASFAGYTASTATVVLSQDGQTETVNFSIAPGIELEDIVVTALGIERQERELGYSVSTVRGDELGAGDGTNLIQSLSGRVSGLDITSSSGSIGGSSRIIIRGVSSLSGDNQPLFVIDGVPISNANIAPEQGRLQGTVDTGNRANDINPADIESVSVLRGGAAAALYGQRAKNGVILITTRRGIDRPRAQVEASTSLLATNVGRIPDFHNEYAPGTAGYYLPTSTSGWGPVIEGQTVDGYILQTEPEDRTPYVLTASPTNTRDFFETGLSSSNNLSFSTGTPTTDFRLGFGYVNTQGIVPNSNLDRFNVSVNAGTRLPNGFSARANVNYINTSDQGRAIQGGNADTMSGLVFSFPRTLDVNDMRNYMDEFGNQRTYGQTGNNPFWMAYENLFTSDLNRVYGAGTLGFEATDWLSFTGRIGTDFYTENRRQVFRHGTVTQEEGAFRSDIIQAREINADLYAQANRDFAEDFTLQALLGTNINQRSNSRVLNSSETLAVDGVYNFANAESNNPRNSQSLQRLAGFYGDVTLGWRNTVFLNVTGRNDISSTLPVENRSYFYPSVSLSAVLTDLIDVDPNILSYGKLRLNVARVGSDEAPYQLAFRYFPMEQAFGQFNTPVIFPYMGFNGYNATSTVPPADLRPQQQTTYEIGLETGFMQDRFNLDLTYYDQVTTDQIISLPRPYSSGFGFLRTNIGAVTNTGFEANLNAETFRIGDFSHSMRATFATNNQRITELADNLDVITLETGYNTIAVRGEVGSPLGLYGTGWLRDPATGLPVIDEETGLRLPGELVRFGDLHPNFRVGFSNTFRYGPVSLSALIDWKDGGVLYSETVAAARRNGRVVETAVNREGTIIDNGVVCDDRDEFTGCRENDVPVVNMQAFWQNLHDSGIQESGVFDASYVKLREVVLTFAVPSNLLQRTPFGSAAISLEGRNLALLYSKIPHIDPETNLFGSGTVGGAGYEFNNLPSSRQFGVSLSVTF